MKNFDIITGEFTLVGLTDELNVYASGIAGRASRAKEMLNLERKTTF